LDTLICFPRFFSPFCFCAAAVFFCSIAAASEPVYRQTDKSDVQWTFSDAEMPGPSAVVQVGFVSAKRANHPQRAEIAVSNNGLTPHCKPCTPITPPQFKPIKAIPPAPTLSTAKTNITGVSQDEPESNDSVIRIAPAVSEEDSPVVLMAEKQINPPPQPPKELLPKALSAEDNTVPETAAVPSGSDSVPANTAGSLSADLFTPHQEFSGSFTAQPKQYVYVAADMVGGLTAMPQQRTKDGNRFFLPNMLASRPNVTEHFNAAVQNRIWADYRHWNNNDAVQSAAGYKNRGSEQFSFGLERKLGEAVSIEVRVPLLCRFASVPLNGQEDEKVAELGNITAFLKSVIRKTKCWTATGGIGVAVPTAKDYWSTGSRLSNELYYLVSFVGLQWHPKEASFGHIVIEADVPLNENKLAGKSLDGQQVIRAGVQLGHWIYQCEPCRLGAFAEADYAVITDGSAGVSAGTITVSALRSRSHTLTGTAGLSAVFNRLTITNAVILPLEHTGQSFSAGYNLSLNRCF
jgi:hypothetical protein